MRTAHLLLDIGLVFLAITATPVSALGIFDNEPPEVITTGPEAWYISPNFDGVQDELILPITIEDRRYITSFRMIIETADGDSVRIIENKDERPENQGILSLLDRIIAARRSLTVPESLRWDGKSDTGAVVPDGTYFYRLDASDDSGNVGSSRNGKVIVDVTAPQVALTAPYLVFSPNDDETKDTLVIEQSGSVEDLWVGVFRDTESADIRMFRWENSPPPQFHWDGKDSSGVLPPDGVYGYVVTGTDRAGNSATARLDSIIINTTSTPVDLRISVREFSPNGDGTMDSVKVSMDVPIRKGIESWEMSIRDEKDAIKRVYEGAGEIPRWIDFDGRDDTDSVLREGIYRALLSVLYVNGSNPKAVSPPFVVDFTAPTAAITVDHRFFSPDGDRRKDFISFYQETSKEQTWDARIVDEDGRAVMAVSWRGNADTKFVWDGRRDDGELAVDGAYRYEISATDLAGNYGEARPISFQLDTGETNISISADSSHFSPNADGRKDQITLFPYIAVETGVESYKLEIRNQEGIGIRTFQGRSWVPTIMVWDGLDNNRRPVPDGGYSAELDVEYKKGNRATAVTPVFSVDTVFPVATVASDILLFSPDADGNVDSLFFRQSSSEELLWEGMILDSRGSAVRKFFWEGTAEDFRWEGKDDNGNPVGDGAYRYVLKSEDGAGNIGQRTVDSLRIDTRPTPVSITVSVGSFSPNGDGRKDAVDLLPDTVLRDGIETWKITIAGAASGVEKEFSGTDSVPERVRWNGVGLQGVPTEGKYNATLSVSYGKGNRSVATSPDFEIDLTPPSAAVEVDFDLFSPNGDGRKDSVTISQVTNEEQNWRGVFLDDAGHPIRTYSWRGKAEKALVWDARKDDGTPAVDGAYTYELSATDSAGNYGKAEPVRLQLDTAETAISIFANPDHFSPNADGKRDGVTLIPVLAVKTGVEVYEAIIRDRDGRRVRAFQERGRSPDPIVWDGLGDGGRPVPDGEYFAELSVEYEKGNKPSTVSPAFVVDTVFPAATVTNDFSLFSPDGDGNLDTLSFYQSSSVEQLWEGRISDIDGVVVRSLFWEGSAGDFQWGGYDNNGNTLADGMYRYELISEDRAGNVTRATVEALRVDTRPTPISITVSDKFLSPNDDGRKDDINLTPLIELQEGIESWKITVQNATSNVEKTFSGTGTVPRRVKWDGLAATGVPLEGKYTATLSLVYSKGNRPETTSTDFEVDLTFPSATASADFEVFSPDGDGRKDFITISQTTSEEQSWRGVFYDDSGYPVKAFIWQGVAETELVWDARNDDGTRTPDGEYSYSLTAEDRAGNISVQSIPSLRIDTKETLVLVSADLSDFSPNGDGEKDSIGFIPMPKVSTGIESFSYHVKNDRGDIIWSYSGSDKAPESVIWNGLDDRGRSVGNGRYVAELTVLYINGNRPVARTNPFNIDLVFPEAQVGSAVKLFSPDGDGRLDSITIRQTSSEEDSWEGRIIDSEGNLILSRFWQGDLENLIWNGRDEKGNKVSDGMYTYSVSAHDSAGNFTEATLDGLTIDTTSTPISLAVSTNAFSPNGDGNKDTIDFISRVEVMEGIESWTLSITDPSSQILKVFSGNDAPPGRLRWNGIGEGGVPKENTYHAILAVEYSKGNLPQARTPDFAIDLAAPEASLSTDLTVFSPNNDGNKDVIAIQQRGSTEEGWSGVFKDEAGRTVRSLWWRGKPASEIVWDGRGTPTDYGSATFMADESSPTAWTASGSLVPDGTYSYLLRSIDEAGNIGEAEPVFFEIDTTETPVQISTNLSYFSPNGDGIKDTVDVVPFLKAETGIEAFAIRIRDENGGTVYTYQGKDEAPDTIAWNGRDESGAVVKDGKFVVEMAVRYRNGNFPSAQAAQFYIDNELPRASISANRTLFSPDGDGRFDSISIGQTSSREDTWEGTIIDGEGVVVKAFLWTERLLDFVWNGLDDDGNKVADGTYSYAATSTDRAGNTTKTSIEDIRIDTRPTPVSVAVSSAAFSPNDDGIIDTIACTPKAAVPEGIAGWSLSIVDARDARQKSFSGTGGLPATVLWDGKAENGSRRQGRYRAVLLVEYLKGNASKSESTSFVLDLVPPKATVEVDMNVFSPNGDGNKDAITISQETSREDSWTGVFKNDAGTIVKRLSWRGTVDSTLVWDGRAESGTVLPDGTYTYTLSATDAAGNTGAGVPASFDIDTVETPVRLSTDLSYFSPNGDGISESIKIAPIVGINSGIESFEIRVKDKTGTTVKTFRETGRAPRAVTWDGYGTAGGLVADGEYHAELEVLYENGNNPVARTNPFYSDTAYPEMRLVVAPPLFSPDGDGRLDTATVRQLSSSEDLWEGKVLDGRGDVVKNIFWKGRAAHFVWDGKDDNGNKIPDGSYLYLVSATDRAGNRTTERFAGIEIDTRPTRVYITASDTAFSPNGDDDRDALEFRPYIRLEEGIKSWKLSMLNSQGEARRVFSGAEDVPGRITWDGKTDSRIAADGEYYAALEVQYYKGNLAESRSVSFLLDVTPPEVEIGLSPIPFSPDNDGVDDEVTISPRVEDHSPISSWNMEVLDPKGNQFIGYEGKGDPAERIIWDGTSDRGELVQAAEDYTLAFSVKDELGNVSTVNRVIPVDVLVIREGDKLKVRISSIIFAPNTANYLDVSEEDVEKNLKTIRRLAEIFQKYDTYNIRIEGHAVMVYWDDPERGKREQTEVLLPLSTERAEAVRDALVELGLDADRLTTVGLGASNPIVSFGDLENRWKNRRVEFILIK